MAAKKLGTGINGVLPSRRVTMGVSAVTGRKRA
jgi:hypothetical protein